MVLAEDLKDKNGWAGTRGKSRYVCLCMWVKERERASSTGRGARAVACRSNAPNLSVKTAVISTTTASNNLMINYWQSPSLLSFSHLPSLCLSQSLSLPSLPFFPKIRLRLQHESCRPVFGSVTSDFAAGAMQHSPQTHTCTASVAMAPARSPQGPSYLHSSARSTPVLILSSLASCQRKAGVRPHAV